MPYIKQFHREHIAAGEQPINSGELNYCITKLVKEFLGDDLTYARINATIGVLECAKLELYRRIAVPYEDMKIQENGDVY